MSEEYINWLEEIGKSLQEIDERMKKINEVLKQADEFDDIDEFESFEYRTEKENAIYEATKNFGRTQFVREIALQIKENKKLKEERETNINFISELQNDLYKITMKNQELTAKIDKAITLIEKNILELRQLGEKEEEKDRWVALTIYAVKNSFFEVEEILKDSDVDNGV